MDKPQLVTAKLKQKRNLNPKVLYTEFEYKNPDTLSFEPGQFISVRVALTTYRSYSICSDYKIRNTLAFVANTDFNGIGANYLNNLKVGDEVEFVGPSGKFVLKQPFLPKMYFYATGTGISPFITFFYKLKDYHYEGEIKVFFGVRNEHELFFLDKLADFRNTFKNFNYEIYVSKGTSDFPYKKGRVNQDLDANIDKEAAYYICGHPDMVEEIVKRLQLKGIPVENIFCEKFTWAIG